MQLSREIRSVKGRLETFLKSAVGRIMIRIFRLVILGAILLWLGYNLYEVGWQAVWNHLPTHPLFYLLFLLMYISAPVADIMIYRYTWRFDIWKNLFAFVKKRVLNTDVVGYSGELYFFTWARRHIGLDDLRIGEIIRDYNILSALASNSRAVVFLLIFSYWAWDPIVELVGVVDPVYVVLGGVVVLILAPIAVRFRKYIFVTSFQTAKVVFSIYFLRLAINTILQIVMWAVVITGVPLVTWIIYSAVSILVSRIPISNKKLVFAGVGAELSQGVGIPKEAMLGLLLTVAALEKVLNFILYGGFMLFGNSSEVNRNANSEKVPEST